MYDKIFARIKPSAKEKEKVKKFVSNLIRVAKTVSGYDCVIVGSIGKQTWLAGDHDVDLFIMFPPSVPREELEAKGLEFGQHITKEMKGKWRVKYAEHPYTHAIIQGYDVDVVPCYRIAKGEKIISAVDRSPLHMEYVLENLTQAMQDQVRLLKQFCKGVGIYGSDAKNLGFSGYICELLIMRYNSFENVISTAAKWEIPVIVDIEVQREQYQKDKFRDQPLIVIDPIDSSRNAAAIVSAQNLLKFMSSAKRFHTKPSQEFFFPKPKPPLTSREIRAMQKRGTKFFAIIMPRTDVIDDVLYPQLRKTLHRIESHLKYNEFLTLRSCEFVGKSCVLVFELENWSLPEIKKMVGPPIFSHRHSQEFLTKYNNLRPPAGFGPYVEENRWVADKAREFISAAALLAALLKMKEEDMQAFGIPKYIAHVMKKAKLLEDSKFFAFVKKDKAFSAILKEEYFEKMTL